MYPCPLPPFRSLDTLLHSTQSPDAPVAHGGKPRLCGLQLTDKGAIEALRSGK